MRHGQDGVRRAGRRGAKLAEVVLFMAIAAAILVGSLSGYREANLSASVAMQARILSALVVEARAVTARSGAVPGRIDVVLVASGAVPVGSIATRPMPYGAPLRTEWDGELAVTLIDVGGDPMLRIRLHDIPVAACTRLSAATQDGQGLFAPGLAGLAVAAGDRGADAGPLPWTVSDVAALCGSVGGGPEGTVTVTYALLP